MVECVDQEGLSELEQDWRLLDQRARLPNPFFSWEWVRCWWDFLGKEKKTAGTARNLKIIIVWKESHLQAVWPFFEVPGIQQTGLWPVGAHSSDRFDPHLLNHDACLTDALCCGLHFLLKTHPFIWLPLIREECFRRTLEESFSRQRLRNWIRERKKNPRIDLRGMNEETYATEHLGKNTRTQLRQLERKFYRNGNSRVHHFHTPEAIQKAFPDLLKVEQSNWKKKQGFGWAGNADAGDYYQKLLPEMAGQGHLWLSMLYLKNQPIAFQIGLIDHRDYLMHHIAFDESLAQASPGKFLLVETIKECIRKDFHRFDMLQGDHPYKLHYATEVASLLDITLTAARPLGWIHRALIQASAALQKRKQNNPEQTSGSGEKIPPAQPEPA